MASGNGFADLPQGLLFYAASIGFASVVLFGLQAIIVGVTGTDIAFIAGGAAVGLICVGVYRFRSRRSRPADDVID